MSDPCDLLTPAPSAADDPTRREELLHRTLGVLRRRRRLRRAAWAAALAACYAAGVLTAHWLRPAPQPAPEMVRTEPQPAPPKVDPPPPVPDPDPTRTLVRAADNLLVEKADPLSALRCYTKALDQGGADALTVSANDTYLMMAIKDARQKEKRDAKNLD
jgi:hypothetical protein